MVLEGWNMKPASNLSALLRTRPGRLVSTTAIAASLLVIPGAASPAQAGHGRYAPVAYHNHGHSHYGPVVAYRPYPRAYYAPIRVRYYRPAIAPGYYYLPSPYVVVHGPTLVPSVVAYPVGAPVVYQDGYCPQGVHYHPYQPALGVHGSFSVHVGF